MIRISFIISFVIRFYCYHLNRLYDEYINNICNRLLGYWNAKAGKDAYQICQMLYITYTPIGRFGISKTNSRGESLLDFAEKYKLVISNILI